MAHRCHARGCPASIPPRMLMCSRHWRQVPRRIQRAVWANYREGQCDDKDPSEGWHQAADAAIGFVALLDKQPARPHEIEALLTYGYGVTIDNYGELYAYEALG